VAKIRAVRILKFSNHLSQPPVTEALFPVIYKNTHY